MLPSLCDTGPTGEPAACQPFPAWQLDRRNLEIAHQLTQNGIPSEEVERLMTREPPSGWLPGLFASRERIKANIDRLHRCSGELKGRDAFLNYQDHAFPFSNEEEEQWLAVDREGLLHELLGIAPEELFMISYDETSTLKDEGPLDLLSALRRTSPDSQGLGSVVFDNEHRVARSQLILGVLRSQLDRPALALAEEALSGNLRSLEAFRHHVLRQNLPVHGVMTLPHDPTREGGFCEPVNLCRADPEEGRVYLCSADGC